MSDSSTISRNTVPDPHPDFSGINNCDPKGRSQLLLKAKKWLPKNNAVAVLACCLARYAHRLIDRRDGKAYSADELETKILAEVGSGHTHVSADITDATTDGFSNQGKVLKTISGIAPPGQHGGVYLAHVTLPETAGSSNNVRIDYTQVQRGAAFMNWPAATGTLACLPPFANSTAANAAVSVGDVWWDTTLNKACVRLS